MSGILGEICHLFCCPPRPSHIVSKLAFLPPPPTYSIVSGAHDSKCHIEFKPEAGWHMTDEDASNLTVFYTITKRQSRIVCMHIRANSSSSSEGATTTTATTTSTHHPTRRILSPIGLAGRAGDRQCQAISASCPTLSDDFAVNGRPIPHRVTADRRGTSSNRPTTHTVLFSHGNAVDIGQMAGFLQSLAYRFNVNILCYDYSGYGVSTGQRLEENLYADAEAVLGELRERFHVPLDQIVLYGQSIGTAPTIDLASKYKVAGVVLHSPFMSGMRVICPGTTRRFCFDPFTNIDKVARITSPTLIIHGTEDEIIGIHHGRELYSRLTHPLDPAWIDGAGHNDIELFAEYTIRLQRFFHEDLRTPLTRPSGDGNATPPTVVPSSSSPPPSPPKASLPPSSPSVASRPLRPAPRRYMKPRVLTTTDAANPIETITSHPRSDSVNCTVSISTKSSELESVQNTRSSYSAAGTRSPQANTTPVWTARRQTSSSEADCWLTASSGQSAATAAAAAAAVGENSGSSVELKPATQCPDDCDSIPREAPPTLLRRVSKGATPTGLANTTASTEG